MHHLYDIFIHLLLAFPNVICGRVVKQLTRFGASRGPSAIAELLVETCH